MRALPPGTASHHASGARRKSPARPRFWAESIPFTRCLYPFPLFHHNSARREFQRIRILHNSVQQEPSGLAGQIPGGRYPGRRKYRSHSATNRAWHKEGIADAEACGSKTGRDPLTYKRLLLSANVDSNRCGVCNSLALRHRSYPVARDLPLGERHRATTKLSEVPPPALAADAALSGGPWQHGGMLTTPNTSRLLDQQQGNFFPPCVFPFLFSRWEEPVDVAEFWHCAAVLR